MKFIFSAYLHTVTDTWSDGDLLQSVDFRKSFLMLT